MVHLIEQLGWQSRIRLNLKECNCAAGKDCLVKWSPSSWRALIPSCDIHKDKNKVFIACQTLDIQKYTTYIRICFAGVTETDNKQRILLNVSSTCWEFRRCLPVGMLQRTTVTIGSTYVWKWFSRERKEKIFPRPQIELKGFRPPEERSRLLAHGCMQGCHHTRKNREKAMRLVFYDCSSFLQVHYRERRLHLSFAALHSETSDVRVLKKVVSARMISTGTEAHFRRR